MRDFCPNTSEKNIYQKTLRLKKRTIKDEKDVNVSQKERKIEWREIDNKSLITFFLL